MSSEFNEAEFAESRAKPDPTTKELHRLTVLKRIESFLIERGVVFEAGPEDDDATIKERYDARGEVNALATISMFFEVLRDTDTPDVLPSPDYKKKLQAKYLVHGYGGAWQDVIDQEIPGEPLGADDEDLIAQIALESTLSDQANEAIFDEIISGMVDFLHANGVEEFGDAEELTLAQLALLKAAIHEDSTPGRLLEEARALVFRNNMDHPAWLMLVQHLFAG